MNYSFDYDNTLIRYKYVRDAKGNIIDAVYDGPHRQNIDLLKRLASGGHNIYIVTARTKGIHLDVSIDKSPKPEEFIKVLDLPIKEVVYTRGNCKLPFLLEKNIREHWDDCPVQCAVIAKDGRVRPWQVPAPKNINAFLNNKIKKAILEQT